MPDVDKKQPLSLLSPESQENPIHNSDLTDMLDYLGVEREYFRKTFSATTTFLPVAEQKHPAGIWLHDEQQTIVCANRHFLDQYGNCIKKRCYRRLMGKENICGCCRSLRAFSRHAPQHCNLCNRKNSGFDINTFHVPITNIYGERFILKSTFQIDYSDAVSEDVFMEGQGECSHHDILVSCSACHRIKDREDNWVRAKKDILEQYSGRISHGMCPKCITLLDPQFVDSLDRTDKKLRPE